MCLFRRRRVLETGEHPTLSGQDAAFCGGFVAMLVGVAQVSAPAAWIVGGGLVVVLCIIERLRG